MSAYTEELRQRAAVLKAEATALLKEATTREQADAKLAVAREQKNREAFIKGMQNLRDDILKTHKVYYETCNVVSADVSTNSNNTSAIITIHITRT
jgi:hypothetical protein